MALGSLLAGAGAEAAGGGCVAAAVELDGVVSCRADPAHAAKPAHARRNAAARMVDMCRF
jgi:hypothetical protein